MLGMHSLRRVGWIGGVAGGLLLAAHAGATGFQRSTLSAAGLGLGNALGADAQHTSSMAYNPSALAFQQGLALEGGLLQVNESLDAAGQTSHPDKDLYVNDFYATYRSAGSPLGFGLGLNRPFRMDTDFTGDFNDTRAATRSELDLMAANPTMAYRLLPDVAVAAGANYYRALDFEYSSVGTKRTGEGGGLGGRLGLMFWREGWTAAATYTSGADLEMDGTNLDGNTFTLPDRARVGLKWRPSLRWSTHFDITRTGWGSYDGLEGVDVAGKDWDASLGYHAGSMYRLSDRASLRFGYAYQEGPKQDSSTFDPRSRTGDRHRLSLGGDYASGGLSYDAAFSYGFTSSRGIGQADVDGYNGDHSYAGWQLMFSVGYDR